MWYGARVLNPQAQQGYCREGFEREFGHPCADFLRVNELVNFPCTSGEKEEEQVSRFQLLLMFGRENLPRRIELILDEIRIVESAGESALKPNRRSGDASNALGDVMFRLNRVTNRADGDRAPVEDISLGR